MKRFLICLLTFLLAFSVASADTVCSFRDINAEDTFKITLTRVLRLTPPTSLDYSTYKTQQGCATDGTYAYFVMESSTLKKGSLWKVKLDDWSVVETAYGLGIDHGNDLTYNPNTNQLVAIHNKPNFYNISTIDPETMQVLETCTMPSKLYSVAYCPERDQYVFGISGSFDFFTTDADFNVTKLFSGKDTGLVKQGGDCDENFIYFPQNDEGCTYNCLVVYDWEGNFVNQIKVSSFQEIESLFHVGDDWYIAFNASGSYCYKVTLTRVDEKEGQ